jgi:hypothetical protein
MGWDEGVWAIGAQNSPSILQSPGASWIRRKANNGASLRVTSGEGTIETAQTLVAAIARKQGV